MRRQKGFTLIEILIVVIILAVLAAMILPRFLGQTENAYIAEAQQVLGVLRRAQANYYDMGNNAFVNLTSTDTVTTMPALGLKGISAANFIYTCATTGTCTAARVGTTANTIALDINGGYTCSGGYTTAGDSKGCKPA